MSHDAVQPYLALPRKQLATVRAILRRVLPGHKAAAFGSRVITGLGRAAKPHSDLDLILEGPSLTLEQSFALREAFNESDLPIRVDFMHAADVPAAWRTTLVPVVR